MSPLKKCYFIRGPQSCPALAENGNFVTLESAHRPASNECWVGVVDPVP